jgi:hypothetical protein
MLVAFDSIRFLLEGIMLYPLQDSSHGDGNGVLKVVSSVASGRSCGGGKERFLSASL